jgi:hypothetical protein
MRRILTFEFVQNNNNARSGFTLLRKKRDGFKSAKKKGGGMILRFLKGRGMVSGLIEKKRDAIPPHPAPLQALVLQVRKKIKSPSSWVTLLGACLYSHGIEPYSSRNFFYLQL